MGKSLGAPEAVAIDVALAIPVIGRTGAVIVHGLLAAGAGEVSVPELGNVEVCSQQ